MKRYEEIGGKYTKGEARIIRETRERKKFVLKGEYIDRREL